MQMVKQHMKGKEVLLSRLMLGGWVDFGRST